MDTILISSRQRKLTWNLQSTTPKLATLLQQPFEKQAQVSLKIRFHKTSIPGIVLTLMTEIACEGK